ncbi:MAG: hypothetical protein JSW09_01135 [Pseudomonadota bacterium]|nr:MAG: hypothetical protein JSW09_01135 [Pseudomonadota bacterium]
MALRLKTKFRTRGPKTIEQRAGVVAFNLWKVSQETYRHMSKEGFKFERPPEIAAAITEILAFLVQVADRLVYGKLSEDDRARFITALCKQLAQTMQANQAEVMGPGDHVSTFIDTLNERFQDYAEFDYTTDGPSYHFLRYFGERMSAALAPGDNKWVVEQVMDIEAPEAIKYTRRLVHEVLGLKLS